jgi:hypothetical protein
VRYFLLCHAVELVLKAYLVLRGRKIEKLKGRPFGHSIKKLLDDAVDKYGLNLDSNVRSCSNYWIHLTQSFGRDIQVRRLLKSSSSVSLMPMWTCSSKRLGSRSMAATLRPCLSKGTPYVINFQGVDRERRRQNHAGRVPLSKRNGRALRDQSGRSDRDR